MSQRLVRGGRIDRDRRIGFTFDGRKMAGFAGDTLASALLAHGVSLVGRSFKYHRPRGIFGSGVEEPSALVTLGDPARREPNIPATTIELREGLVAESQNRWPTLRYDLQSLSSLFSPLLPAGFYYKTFMGPTRRAWMVYETWIRRAAGLGRAGAAPDSDRYETRHAFCDIAVIGAGPAGLAAALAASRTRGRVAMVEQDFALGGTLLSHLPGGSRDAWLRETLAELESSPNLAIMRRATAFGVYDGGTIGVIERSFDEGRTVARQTLVMLRCRAIILATGAIERPLLFVGNDRPGVMLASAAQAYLHRFGVLAGNRVVVAVSDDSGYGPAVELAGAGAEVRLADLRTSPPPSRLAAAAAAGIPVFAGAALHGAHGGRRVDSVDLGLPSGAKERLACDLLCVSGGWTPTIHLACHLGARPRYRPEIGAFLVDNLPPGWFTAGAAAGAYDTDSAIEEGARAAAAAAEHCGLPVGRQAATPVPPLERSPPAVARPQALALRAPGKAFVDLQNDVTVADVRLAHREGYVSVEHLKRYTTLGMGTDQGKTSNLAALELMAELIGTSPDQVGTTTFRPPYTPVTIGALAGRSIGRHFRPTRRTPMHDWHRAHGAEMIEVGLWMRPWFYRGNGANVDEAYVNEMRAVREAAGLVDISTLGKIEVQGADSLAFLERVYANSLATLAIGRARYGVMLRDDGIVFDDGTVTRLGERHFFVTTSTARTADAMSWLEFLLDTAWTDLEVHLTSVTDDWAAMSLAGAASRRILGAAFPGIDLSDAALPHMGALDGEHGGFPLRILRLSYSGELAFEIYVAAPHGLVVWERLIAAGADHGLQPYGVEALGALRVEKGHAAGPEIDGRTTLRDLGLERMASRKKAYIGAVLAERPAFREPARRHLVGLECLESGGRLRSGAVLFEPGEGFAGHGRGRVTSTTWSPTLERFIGLGFWQGDRIAEGKEVIAVHALRNETVRARMVPPIFLDPAGERLRG